MIRKGSIVKRKPLGFCVKGLGLRARAILNDYPPEHAICIVTSKPKEVDLSPQTTIKTKNLIELRKGVDLICDGKWYGPCDMRAFEEVKSG